MVVALLVTLCVLLLAGVVLLVVLLRRGPVRAEAAQEVERRETRVGQREERAERELQLAREAQDAAREQARQLDRDLSRARDELRRAEQDRAQAQREQQAAQQLADEVMAARVRTEQARAQVEQDRLAAGALQTAAEQTRGAAERVRTQAEQAAADVERLRAQVEAERLEARRVQAEAEQQRAALAAAEADLATRREQLQADLDLERAEALERVAAFTHDQAKAELKAAVEQQAKREAALTVRQIEAEAKENGEALARQIVVDAVQRVASDQTAESVVSVLALPSDDMKGRIIGREGRNIRSFEQVTGVNVVIDDTPDSVLLSCFDPVRREVGRRTLSALVADGRIHPLRIEELYERSKAEVEAGMQRAGEDALVEAGLTDVHPDLVTLLGRLRYRTSYGQNVLAHLVETAHIASHMASELGVDPSLVKRGAFLHDVGKALTHEVEGSHAALGADLARRYGEREEVVHAIAAHHGEVAPETVEAVLTQASDSCSGGRPGARRDSLEAYVKRLDRIEEIASSKRGVERVFAMQAGREVRVMVQPDEIDDLEALVLAREVAQQIQDELTYPGQIRVTVVRESRATEIAH